MLSVQKCGRRSRPWPKASLANQQMCRAVMAPAVVKRPSFLPGGDVQMTSAKFLGCFDPPLVSNPCNLPSFCHILGTSSHLYLAIPHCRRHMCMTPSTTGSWSIFSGCSKGTAAASLGQRSEIGDWQLGMRPPLVRVQSGPFITKAKLDLMDRDEQGQAS